LQENKEAINSAYARYFDHLCGFLPDLNKRILIAPGIKKSTMRMTIAENISGLLDHFGAHDAEITLYKLFARWVFALGHGKLKLNPPVKKDPPPAVTRVSRSASRPAQHVKPIAYVFDMAKKLDRKRPWLNRCRILGCNETTGLLPVCEYHTHMLVDLATEKKETSTTRSLADASTRSYALDRVDRFSSWGATSTQTRARFMHEAILLLQDKLVQELVGNTPEECLRSMMSRFESGVNQRKWSHEAFKNPHLSRRMEELVENFYKLKRAHDWIGVENRNTDGNFVSVELWSDHDSEVRCYEKVSFVNRCDEGILITREGANLDDETHQAMAMRRAFGQTRVAEITREIENKRRDNFKTNLAPELVYLRDLTKSLGVKLVILMANEGGYDSLCQAFDADSESQDNNHVDILCQRRAKVTDSTIRILEKHNTQGRVAAPVPVQESVLVRTFPPQGIATEVWSFLINLVLNTDPEKDLFPENLVGEVKISSSRRLQTKQRELRAFWIVRFIHWMTENNKLGDLGLVYGDFQAISTPRETIKPSRAELDGLRKKTKSNEVGSQKAYIERAIKTTKHFPFMTNIVKYGEESILNEAIFEFTPSQLSSMAVAWNEFHFCPAGSMWPDEFIQLWNVRDKGFPPPSAIKAAARTFDRKQAISNRRKLFEKTSGLREELRARALEERMREQHLDWFVSTSDEEIEEEARRCRDLTSTSFPAVNNQPLQVVKIEEIPSSEDESHQNVPIPDPDLDEVEFLNTGEEEETELEKPEPQTPAGTAPNLDEVNGPLEISEAEQRRMYDNANMLHAKQQMIKKTIKPGGRWDPLRLVGPDLASPEQEQKGIEILKALAEVRMFYDKMPNALERLEVTTNPTDKVIIENLSKSLVKVKAAPDIVKLAQDTKCSISEVATRVAALNLSGAAVPETTPKEHKIYCSDLVPLCYDHRADTAPSTEARDKLAELGVIYLDENLIASDNIKIEYDLETRMLINRAAKVLSYDFEGETDPATTPLDSMDQAMTAAAYLAELLLHEPLPLTQYLACICANSGQLSPSRIRQGIYYNLKFSLRLNRVKQWAIHFLPTGEDKF
ncbi:unnamed protein product, partial [Oikopleura dioica]